MDQTGEATWLTARNYEGAALDADNAKYINTLINSNVKELSNLRSDKLTLFFKCWIKKP